MVYCHMHVSICLFRAAEQQTGFLSWSGSAEWFRLDEGKRIIAEAVVRITDSITFSLTVSGTYTLFFFDNGFPVLVTGAHGPVQNSMRICSSGVLP